MLTTQNLQDLQDLIATEQALNQLVQDFLTLQFPDAINELLRHIITQIQLNHQAYRAHLMEQSHE